MKNFSSVYLTEPNKNIEADTNEVVGLILATMILSTALRPALGGDGKGSRDGGASFWDFMINYSNNKRVDKKEKDEKKDEEDEKKDEPGVKDGEDTSRATQDNKIFNDLLILSRKANQKEKDENAKKKNDAMIKLLTACSFDKDGNELPIDERIGKMKDNMSDDQFEAFKKDMLDTYEKCKDDVKFKDALNKEREKITPETYEKAMEDAKKEAKATLEQLEKEREEIEEHEAKLKEIEEQLKNADGDEKKELTAQLEKEKQNAPQTLVGSATGVDSAGENTTTGNEDGNEGKKKTKEEIDDEHDKIKKDYKEKSDKLTQEYQEKIDNEKDPDKKKELEDEWQKKETQLSAEKNKAMDALDDNDDHDTEKDETKQGKYKVNDEEITDPETGEKKKVKTYTGPRGGKFYYPDGAPKKPENKVYIEHLSLSDYLIESMQ